MLTTSIVWGIAARLAGILALAWCAANRYSILGACVVSACATLIVNVFLYRQILHRFSHLRPFLRGGQWRLGFRNLAKSLIVTGSGALGQLQNSWLIVAIAASGGSILVPCFTTCRTLGNAFGQCTCVLSTATYPEITRYHAKGETQKLVACIGAVWAVGGVGINLSLLLTLPFVQFLYLLWTRHVINFDLTLYILLACSIALKNSGAPLLNYLTGINDLKAQLSIAIFQTTTVALLAATLLAKWKLVGVGIALLGGEFIGSFLLPVVFFLRQLKRSGHGPPIRLLASAWLGTSIVIAVCLPAAAGAISPLRASVLGLIALTVCLPLQWLGLPPEVRSQALASVPLFRQRGRQASA
jgi:O-antigen/teichoic acid export membrane protein